MSCKTWILSPCWCQQHSLRGMFSFPNLFQYYCEHSHLLFKWSQCVAELRVLKVETMYYWSTCFFVWALLGFEAKALHLVSRDTLAVSWYCEHPATGASCLCLSDDTSPTPPTPSYPTHSTPSHLTQPRSLHHSVTQPAAQRDAVKVRVHTTASLCSNPHHDVEGLTQSSCTRPCIPGLTHVHRSDICFHHVGVMAASLHWTVDGWAARRSGQRDSCGGSHEAIVISHLQS